MAPHGTVLVSPRGGTGSFGPRLSKSLVTGLQVLQCFTRERPVLGIAQMADMLQISRSTGHRYASTLVALGWLEQTTGRKYRPAAKSAAPGLAVLGEIILATSAQPVLQALREQTGCTASLGVLDGDCVRYVRRLHAHREGQHEADGELRAGARVPVHCTAIGKILLASLPEDELHNLLARLQLERRTPQTVTTKKRLAREIEQARSKGLAVSERELVGKECSLAVVVERLCGGRRLAVEVTAPVALGSEVLCAVAGERVRLAAARMGGRL